MNELFQQDVIILLNGFPSEQKEIIEQLKQKNTKLIPYNCNYYYVFQEDVIFNEHKWIHEIILNHLEQID